MTVTIITDYVLVGLTPSGANCVDMFSSRSDAELHLSCLAEDGFTQLVLWRHSYRHESGCLPRLISSEQLSSEESDIMPCGCSSGSC